MSNPSARPATSASIFEALETRSMMAAQPIYHDADTAASANLSVPMQASAVKAMTSDSGPQLAARAVDPTHVRLIWTEVDGATGYRVERLDGKGTDWQPVATTARTTLNNFTRHGNRMHRYRVAAVMADGSELSSDVVSIRPEAALAAAAARAEKIAGMVELFRADQMQLVADNADKASDPEFRAMIDEAQSTFAAKMAAMHAEYAPMSVEELLPSFSLNATPRVSSVPPVASVAVRNVGELALTWTSVTGAMAYKVERSGDSGSTWAAVNYSTGVRFIDVGLAADTSYQYRVSAITASDTSAPSVAVTGTTSPVSPTGLAATPSSTPTTVNLAWDASSTATSFTIERSTNNTNWTALTPTTPLTGSDTSYADDTASAGTTYYYRISLVNGSRTSAPSTPVTATTLTTAPVLTATAQSGTRVALSWPAKDSAFEYKIERSDDAGTTYTVLATVSGTRFVDGGLTANSAYKYRVSATNAGGTSAASTVVNVKTLLATVTGFTAAPSASADEVVLTWSAVTDATGYVIQRSVNGTTWTSIDTSALAGTDATITDSTVSPGTTYSYRIQAKNAEGNGALADPITALIRPATPGGVSVTAPTTDSVTVSWTAVATATGYTIQKSTDSGGTWANVGTTTTAVTFTDTGLAANADLQYRVKATNATGASDYGAEVSITTAPATPANLAGTFNGTTGKIDLTWDLSADATTYTIERTVGTDPWVALTPGTPFDATSAAYSDNDSLTTGTTFKYRITATNANGTSPVSSVISVLTKPAVPTLTATPATATSMGLSWTASPTATAYTLQASDDAGSTWTTAYTGANTTFTVTGLTANTDYSYQVLATNATGSSDYSTQVDATTILDVPANLAATTPSGTSVALTWDASTDATGYKIERNTAGSTWTTVVPSPALTGSSVTYTDTGLVANTAYQYRLSATNANGTSAATAAVSVTTRVGVTATVTAATTSSTALAVSWTAVPGATSYKLESSADGGTSWTTAATQAGLTYAHTGLTANTAYKYRVTASNTLGDGAASTAITGTTLAGGPASFAAASPSNTSATLTWAATTGATGYRIERSANNGSTWTMLAPSPALTGSSTTYTDTGLTAATSYKYRIAAVTPAGNGDTAAAVTLLTRPNAAIITGVVNSGTQVTINWTAVTGATSYVVQKSADAGATWTAAGTSTTATQAVTGLTANTSYQFRVMAANASGNAAASNSVTLKTLIATPANFAATTTNATSVVLGWNVVTGASGYKIEKAIGSGAFVALVPSPAFTGTTATYTDTTLAAGSTYRYRITTLSTSNGTSAASSELTVLTRPAAPVATSTTPSTTQINLTWATIPSATSYKVEQSTDGGTTWTVAGTPTATSYNATGLTVDSAYSFRVSAVNATGAGAASTVVATRTLPTPPTDFDVIDAGSATVTLVWTGVDSASTYVLERSTNGTTWTTVVPSPALVGTDSSYTDTGLAGGTTYQYRISASNAAGKSAVSSTVSATTLAAAPVVTASVTSGTAVNLSWTASATATSYRVERSANNGSTWATIASPATNSFVDSGVQAGRNYTYRVTAVNGSGAGDPSAEVNVATLMSAPTNLAATTGSATSISLAWTAPAGATGYTIERSTDATAWTTLTQSPVLGGSSTYFNSTGLTAGTDYYYRITALGSGSIVSPTSKVVRGTTTLAAPTGLAASAYSTTQINLAWTNPANYSRTGYKLQRSPNGTNSWVTIATPAATATSYSNTGLVSKTRYFYRLIAVSLAGDSAAGAVVNATTK